MISLVLGTIGTTLGLINYFKDRARLSVYMKNNWKVEDSQENAASGSKYTIIEITNIGRRPISIDNVFLIFPNGETGDINELMFDENKKIEEGEVKKYKSVQDDFPESVDFRRLQACVRDSAGSFWYSNPINMKVRIIFFMLRLKRYLKGISY